MTEPFFEPGAEYDAATGYSAPEIIRTFRCVAVAENPGTGEPFAFGFIRSAARGWGGTGMGIHHWQQGWNRTSRTPGREPSEGLKALAEANEREKAKQAAMSPEELEQYRAAQAEHLLLRDPDSLDEPERPASHYFATKSDREAFATMFADKLDTWFTSEFATYLRTGAYPGASPGHEDSDKELCP